MPLLSAEDAFKCTNSSILSHKMKKCEEAHSFQLTMDHDEHHGLTVAVRLSFFLHPMGIWNEGTAMVAPNVPK